MVAGGGENGSRSPPNPSRLAETRVAAGSARAAQPGVVGRRPRRRRSPRLARCRIRIGPTRLGAVRCRSPATFRPTGSHRCTRSACPRGRHPIGSRIGRRPGSSVAAPIRSIDVGTGSSRSSRGPGGEGDGEGAVTCRARSSSGRGSGAGTSCSSPCSSPRVPRGPAYPHHLPPGTGPPPGIALTAGGRGGKMVVERVGSRNGGAYGGPTGQAAGRRDEVTAGRCSRTPVPMAGE